MRARVWRRSTPQAPAGDYQRHYEPGVSEQLRALTGFRAAQLLRRDAGGK